MELAIILVLALLVFGPKKLPEIGKGIGEAMREFRKASRDLMSSLNDEREVRSYSAPAADSYASTSPETNYPMQPPSAEPASVESAPTAAIPSSSAGSTATPTAAPPHATPSTGHETAQAPERTS
jgi:TatA/E family protein of Tat protein translocase